MTIRVLVLMNLMSRCCSESNSVARYVRDFAYSTSPCAARQHWTRLDGCIGQHIIPLVSDINMPGMSGLDLLPIVKTRRPDLPVFMISAYGDAEADSRGALAPSTPSTRTAGSTT